MVPHKRGSKLLFDKRDDEFKTLCLLDTHTYVLKKVKRNAFFGGKLFLLPFSTFCFPWERKGPPNNKKSDWVLKLS